jgi:hypothetical protein
MNQQVQPPSPEPALPVLAPEDYPQPDHLVFEDNTPADSLSAEKQQRLLTEPLYASWPGPGEGRPFLALANVGLFSSIGNPPEVPDAMLSLDVQAGEDLTAKENRSYLLWVMDKAPDGVVEIVSDRRGGEDTHKLRRYARMRVLYYAIYDPRDLLGQGVLRTFEWRRGNYEAIDASWFPAVGLGLSLWEGEYEGHRGMWLRWCDQEGRPVPTGKERAEEERRRADRAEEQAERLRAQLRALGVNPDA